MQAFEKKGPDSHVPASSLVAGAGTVGTSGKIFVKHDQRIMVLNMFISPDVSDKLIIQDIISNSDFVFLKICLLVISKGGGNYLA